MTDNQSPIEVALDVLVYAPLGLAVTVGEELPKLAAKGRARVQVARLVGQFALAQGRKEVGRRFGAGEPPRPAGTRAVPDGPAPTTGADGSPASEGTTAPGVADPATSAFAPAASPLAGSARTAAPGPGSAGAHTGGRPSAAAPSEVSPAPSAASAAPSRLDGSSRPDGGRRRASSRPAGRPGGGATAGTGAAASLAESAPPSPEHLAIPGYDSLSASQVVQRLAGLSAEELEAVKAYEAGTRGRRTILARVGQLQGS